MAKTLRLGFVMGGGVSLGTFSGAALSETIKQQLLYGRYDTGEKDAAGKPIFALYDKVEIDVLCGASAGALSLAILLRMLVNYQDKHAELGFDAPSAFDAALEKELRQQFGDAAINQLQQEQPHKWPALLAAQAVQHYQAKLWGEEVDIERLLGVGAHYKDLSHTAGLIDREVVDELARQYLQFRSFSNRMDNRQLLADRVLFGCTLANLTYNLQSASSRFPHIAGKNSSILKALNDRLVERVHSELRVFDVNFQPLEEKQLRYYPLKWRQYHLGDALESSVQDRYGTAYAKKVNDLRHNDTWREMAATAIASGAFPFAFAPVVLNRYRHEYGTYWPKELQHQEQHPFTYVDGGTFNNEPIRKALELASYLDGQAQREDFERQIVFVDPNVTELYQSFRVGVHNPYGVARSVLAGDYKASEKSTFGRLLSKLPNMLGAVLHEAQASETEKLCELLERQASRDQMRGFYKALFRSVPDDETFRELRLFVQEELYATRHRLELPSNSLQIQQELLRVLQEEEAYFKEYIPWDDREGWVHRFVQAPYPSVLPHAEVWLYALMCVLLDTSLELTGRLGKATLVPIAPFDFYEKHPNNEYQLLKLPGYGMKGFVGFASAEASRYELEYGRYCSARILNDLGLLQSGKNDLPLPERFDYQLFDEALKRRFSRALLKRIKEMVPSGIAGLLPFLEGFLNDSIDAFIERNLDGRQRRDTFLFKITVPGETYVLRGYDAYGQHSTKKSLLPFKSGNNYQLIAILHYDWDSQTWLGQHTNAAQCLIIDKEQLFENQRKVRIELPRLEKDAELRHYPNPIFEYDASGDAQSYGESEVEAQYWKHSDGVAALDRILWGEDNWLQMMERIED